MPNPKSLARKSAKDGVTAGTRSRGGAKEVSPEWIASELRAGAESLARARQFLSDELEKAIATLDCDSAERHAKALGGVLTALRQLAKNLGAPRAAREERGGGAGISGLLAAFGQQPRGNQGGGDLLAHGAGPVDQPEVGPPLSA